MSHPLLSTVACTLTPAFATSAGHAELEGLSQEQLTQRSDVIITGVVGNPEKFAEKDSRTWVWKAEVKLETLDKGFSYEKGAQQLTVYFFNSAAGQPNWEDSVTFRNGERYQLYLVFKSGIVAQGFVPFLVSREHVKSLPR